MISLKRFGEYIAERLRKDWDVVIAITGEEGSGKSSLMIQLGKLIDKKFNLRRNVSFIPRANELAKQFNDIPEYSFLGVDEAVRALHKFDWMTNVQQTLLKLYATERYQHKSTCVVLPRFRDLTENFRNHRVKIRIFIIKRGLAVVHLINPNEYVKDPWHMDENLQTTERTLQRKKTIGISPEDLLRAERKTKTYWFDFEFPDLDPKVKEEYQALRKESRDKIDYEDQFRHDKRLDKYKESNRKWKMTTYNLLREKGVIKNMEDMRKLYHETGDNIWLQAKQYREKKGLPALADTIREDILIPAEDFTLPELEQKAENQVLVPISNITVSEKGTQDKPKREVRRK